MELEGCLELSGTATGDMDEVDVKRLANESRSKSALAKS